jgi:hypothetical protein
MAIGELATKEYCTLHGKEHAVATEAYYSLKSTFIIGTNLNMLTQVESTLR